MGLLTSAADGGRMSRSIMNFTPNYLPTLSSMQIVVLPGTRIYGYDCYGVAYKWKYEIVFEYLGDKQVFHVGES
jgi:hypothetical protein